jgi:hypothetical protein
VKKLVRVLWPVIAALILLLSSPLLAANTATAGGIGSTTGHPRTSLQNVIAPCGVDTAVLRVTNQPSALDTTYQITFTAQGVGRMVTQSSPYNYWVLTDINSPSAPQAYTDTLTVHDPYFRFTLVQMDANPAPCSVYANGLTISNATITPLP